MPHTPRARNPIRTDMRAVIILVTLLGSCSLTAGNSSRVPVIDLTRNIRPEETITRYPGASSDSYKPDWFLPLSLEEVQLTTVDVNDYRVRVKVVNRGTASFRMPSSLNARAVDAKGNRGRRTMLFELDIRDVSADKSQTVAIAVAKCSDSIPESYVSLDPGQSVEVLMRLSANSLWKLQSIRDLKIRLRISESVLSNSAFFIEAMSAPLVSTELTCSNVSSGFKCH